MYLVKVWDFLPCYLLVHAHSDTVIRPNTIISLAPAFALDSIYFSHSDIE